jgi:transposase-like protein
MNNVEICEHLGIKKASLYNWLKAIGHKAEKDESGRSFYLPATIKELEKLKEHIRAGGKMDEWRGGEIITTKPEATSLDTQGVALGSEDPRLTQLLDNAHRQAVGVLIAQNILAGKFIENPDTLPEEYRAMVELSAPVPKSIDPLEHAKKLVQKLAIEGSAA